MPLHEEGMPDPEGLQLCKSSPTFLTAEQPLTLRIPGVDLPQNEKLCKPNYQELTAEQIPSAHPSEHTTIKVIVGAAQGSEAEGLIKSPIKPVGGVEYYDFKMTKSGESYWQPVCPSTLFLQ
jgi:hypothetical protein